MKEEPREAFMKDYMKASNNEKEWKYHYSYTDGDWCHVIFWDEDDCEVKVKLSTTVPRAEGGTGNLLRSVVNINSYSPRLGGASLDLYHLHPALNNKECVLWFEDADTVHFLQKGSMYNRKSISRAYDEIVLRHPLDAEKRYFVIVKDGYTGKVDACPLKLRLLLDIMRESVLGGLYEHEYEIAWPADS